MNKRRPRISAALENVPHLKLVSKNKCAAAINRIIFYVGSNDSSLRVMTSNIINYEILKM